MNRKGTTAHKGLTSKEYLYRIATPSLAKVPGWFFYALKHYFKFAKTNVSNARMNIPKAIRSLKSNGFLSISTTPILCKRVVSETLEPLKIQCFQTLFFFFYLNFYSFFCIFFLKICLTYLPVCAACFVALPGLKARPLIDNMFPFHISIKGGSAHVKTLAVSSGIFTLPA